MEHAQILSSMKDQVSLWDVSMLCKQECLCLYK
jgi:hypothetical protein